MTSNLKMDQSTITPIVLAPRAFKIIKIELKIEIRKN